VSDSLVTYPDIGIDLPLSVHVVNLLEDVALRTAYLLDTGLIAIKLA
jgi:hypothetical protein